MPNGDDEIARVRDEHYGDFARAVRAEQQMVRVCAAINASRGMEPAERLAWIERAIEEGR